MKFRGFIFMVHTKRALAYIRNFPLEATVWTTGLMILSLSDPLNDQHFTICPLALAGFDWCPGCGLGRSISFLFMGEWQLSFSTHPLGLPAVIVLTFRIFQLIKNHLKIHGKDN